MARDDSRGGSGGRRGKPLRRRKKRPCLFCTEGRSNIIDYKNVDLLRSFQDDRARIRKARQTGSCRKHQARVAQALKRAREIALLPYTND